ncbi:Carbohydrate family 9 binding domain-like [Zhouia amylolytica]|nr:carbohydrate-binding family 9-like protein [Zhouia amylolytica]SFT15412.1 Carbohydrate family 9 binding domain-like [Zhouia amylolytica]
MARQKRNFTHLLKHSMFVLASGFVLTACAQSASKAPRSYVAHKTTENIVVDGKADEESWEKAPWSDNFIDIEGVKTPTYKTNMKMLWDDEYLYFFADLEEPHVWGTLKQRDTVIFYNNDFEIFIDPDGDTHNYMEFEMNALNTIWDLLLVKPYREHSLVLDSWDIQGIKTAVHVNGTLNNPNDKDSGWSVEIAMPWKVLTEANSHGKIPEDEFWRINFSRVNWDFELVDGRYQRKKDESGKYLPEYNWVWSPQGVINMHEPEHWGYVYFTSKGVDEKVTFEIPEDEAIKWQLYALYRKQKAFKNKNGKWAASMDELAQEPIKVKGKEIQPSIELHEQGWNIKVESPFTNQVLIIKEDGDFLKSKN